MRYTKVLFSLNNKTNFCFLLFLILRIFILPKFHPFHGFSYKIATVHENIVSVMKCVDLQNCDVVTFCASPAPRPEIVFAKLVYQFRSLVFQDEPNAFSQIFAETRKKTADLASLVQSPRDEFGRKVPIAAPLLMDSISINHVSHGLILPARGFCLLFRRLLVRRKAPTFHKDFHV